MTCRVLREPHRLVEARQQYVDDLLLQLEKGWQNSVQERTRRVHQATRTLVTLESAAALAAAWDTFAHITASAGHSHAVASDVAPRTIKWSWAVPCIR